LCNGPQGFGEKTSGILNGNGNLIPTYMYGAWKHVSILMDVAQIKHKLHQYTYIIELYHLTSK
jgi:hypothetical protein